MDNEPYPVVSLTVREIQILRLITHGLSNRAIAEKMTVAPPIVRWSIKQIYRKLGVSGRIQAVTRARELDLLQDRVIELQGTAAPFVPLPGSPPPDFSASIPPFIGREVELAEIARRLSDPACQLLTIVGPGGIGKTRLSVQATQQNSDFIHGVYFVPLAPINSPDMLASAIADALGITFFGSESPETHLIDYLCERHVLLLLDNLEHLLEGVQIITDILDNAPNVKILVTSRERLNLQEEWVLTLEGLPFPHDQSTLPIERYASAQLFAQRARMIQANFSLVENAQSITTICLRVEGMPLAIELAATWLRVMSCQQIAAQIERGFDFLISPLRNIPERHRSLRAVFEQSWQWLSEVECRVLARLSIFRGGFDLTAAEGVADASLSLLAGLADKSLIRLNSAGRYDMHEMLRQFAADKLAQWGETAAVTQRHLEFFSSLADEAAAHLYSPDQESWFDHLDIEAENLDAALAWALRDASAEAGLHLSSALGFYWEIRGHHSREGYARLEKLLEIAQDAPVKVRSKAQRVISMLASSIGDNVRARAACEVSLLLAREANDPWSIAWALGSLGFSFTELDDRHLALLEEALALFRAIGDGWGISQILKRMAFVAIWSGRLDLARARGAESLGIDRAAQNKYAMAWSLSILGITIWMQYHDAPQVLPLIEESLVLARQARDQPHLIVLLALLGELVQTQGNYPRAQAHYIEGLTIAHATGTNNVHTVSLIIGLGELAAVEEKLVRAAILFGAVIGFVNDIQNIPIYKRAELERAMAAVRNELGEARFATALAQGQAMTMPRVITFVMQEAIETPRNKADLPSKSVLALIEPLTEREREILRMLADGLSNAEIAQMLVLSVATVKVHAHNLYGKLGVNTRTQAVACARKLELL